MARNLPIKFNIFDQNAQLKLPPMSMPNIALSPLKMSDIPLQLAGNTFTTTPLTDDTKVSEDNILSSLFGETELTQKPIADNLKRVITDEELEKAEIEIRKTIQAFDSRNEIITDEVLKKVRKIIQASTSEDEINISDNIDKKYTENPLAVNPSITTENQAQSDTQKEFSKKKEELKRMIKDTAKRYFWGEYQILEATNPDNIEIAEMISKNKTLLFHENIIDILKATNGVNLEIAKLFLQKEEFFKEPLRDRWAPALIHTSPENIIGILKNINSDNLEFAKIICNDKDFITKENLSTFRYILEVTDSENFEFAKWICTSNETQKIRHSVCMDYFPRIIDRTTKDRTEFAKYLCVDEKFTYGDNNIEYFHSIIEHINNTNQEIAKTICQKIPLEGIKFIPKILQNINENNIKLAELIFQNEELINKINNIESIADILKETNVDNIEAAKIICLNEKFTNNNNIWVIAGLLEETNANNIELAKIICQDKDFTCDENIRHIRDILNYAENNPDFAMFLCTDEKCKIFRQPENIKFISKVQFAYSYLDKKNFVIDICSDKKYEIFRQKGNIEYLDDIIFSVRGAKRETIDKILFNNDIPMQYKADMINLAKKFDDDNLNYLEIIHRFENAKENMLKKPEIYLNGTIENIEEAKDKINGYFSKSKSSLLLASVIFDKETLDCLLRLRLDETEVYLNKLFSFCYACELKQAQQYLKLLRKMINSKDITDKPLSPMQKIECIDIMESFDNIKIPLSIIEEAIADNKIDLSNLKTRLFKEILKICGMDKEQVENLSEEKLMLWKTEYLHLLPKSIGESRQASVDLLNAAFSGNFMEYIRDKNNDYGEANENTKIEFEKKGMNYEKWEKADKNLEITFVSKDNNKENIMQLSNSLMEDIDTLRNSPVKGFFDKQFAKYIQNGKFILPQKIASSKAELTELIENIIEQLKPVWERAEKNKDNSEKQTIARKTLTILSHLQTKLESLQKMKDIPKEKSYDLTVKMWDRNPQKDLFQGNYSTCCIGMGGINAGAMPHYLMNTAFNMIELVDNNTGKTIGNALCYFVQNTKGTPIFVIDNIEINNSQLPSENTGINLRNTIFEYAANIAKSVTGQETDVILGGEYNDVRLKGLEKGKAKLKLIGDIDCENIYMDLFDGWTDEWDEFNSAEFFRR